MPTEDGVRGWYAFTSLSDQTYAADDLWEAPPEGSTIRLMGEHTVSIPLWDEQGLMFGDREQLLSELSVTPALARDLETWGLRWQEEAGLAALDADALLLVERLTAELGHLWRFVYKG